MEHTFKKTIPHTRIDGKVVNIFLPSNTIGLAVIIKNHDEIPTDTNWCKKCCQKFATVYCKICKSSWCEECSVPVDYYDVGCEKKDHPSLLYETEIEKLEDEDEMEIVELDELLDELDVTKREEQKNNKIKQRRYQNLLLHYSLIDHQENEKPKAEEQKIARAKLYKRAKDLQDEKTKMQKMLDAGIKIQTVLSYEEEAKMKKFLDAGIKIDTEKYFPSAYEEENNIKKLLERGGVVDIDDPKETNAGGFTGFLKMVEKETYKNRVEYKTSSANLRKNIKLVKCGEKIIKDFDRIGYYSAVFFKYRDYEENFSFPCYQQEENEVPIYKAPSQFFPNDPTTYNAPSKADCFRYPPADDDYETSISFPHDLNSKAYQESTYNAPCQTDFFPYDDDDKTTSSFPIIYFKEYQEPKASSKTDCCYDDETIVPFFCSKEYWDEEKKKNFLSVAPKRPYELGEYPAEELSISLAKKKKNDKLSLIALQEEKEEIDLSLIALQEEAEDKEEIDLSLIALQEEAEEEEIQIDLTQQSIEEAEEKEEIDLSLIALQEEAEEEEIQIDLTQQSIEESSIDCWRSEVNLPLNLVWARHPNFGWTCGLIIKKKVERKNENLVEFFAIPKYSRGGYKVIEQRQLISDNLCEQYTPADKLDQRKREQYKRRFIELTKVYLFQIINSKFF
jgi:hypothetical protein